jgi:hypothetical protein
VVEGGRQEIMKAARRAGGVSPLVGGLKRGEATSKFWVRTNEGAFIDFKKLAYGRHVPSELGGEESE